LPGASPVLQSLGYETARQLTAAGHTVDVGSRDGLRGKEAAGRLGARLLVIDVTSDDSVQAAAGQIREEEGHLDVLINNAGISGGRKAPAEGTQTVEEGAEIIVRMAQVGPDGPTGSYFNRHGTVPW
jgi:NAD(P)-dependent dehydrogenase (short-subunit alcohol dehydrogenase family)